VLVVVQVTTALVLSTLLLTLTRRFTRRRWTDKSLALWAGVMLICAALSSGPVIMLVLGMLGIGVAVPPWLVVAAVVLLFLAGFCGAGAVLYLARSQQR
jgi:hypothetical protein